MCTRFRFTRKNSPCTCQFTSFLPSFHNSCRVGRIGFKIQDPRSAVAFTPREIKHLERAVLLERRRESPSSRGSEALVPRQKKTPDARRRRGHARDNPTPITSCLFRRLRRWVPLSPAGDGVRQGGRVAVVYWGSNTSSISSFCGGRALKECRGDGPGTKAPYSSRTEKPRASDQKCGGRSLRFCVSLVRLADCMYTPTGGRILWWCRSIPHHPICTIFNSSSSVYFYTRGMMAPTAG